jgi:hypothetical protein
LNLRKAFENQRDRLWPAFKIGEWFWLTFKIGELALAGFQIGKLALAGFQNLSTQLQEICYPIGAKDLNSPVLKSFLQFQKLFALNG